MDATADFTWLDGERLIRFGAGALTDAPRLLHERGFDGYALLTTDRALEQAPDLRKRAATVLRVPPGYVPDAAAAVRGQVSRRPILALGGGRVIDAAKAIAAADGLACAAVPTTLSGAEVTPFHRLPAGVDHGPLIRPSLVLAAPELMASQETRALAASAMNALGHAAEALWVRFANPVAEMAALRAVELLSRGLAAGSHGRPENALGGLLAGYAVGSALFGVHHVVCQTIVRVAGTPHAETNAVMLPHVVRLMEGRAPAALGRLARALGDERGDPSAAPVHVAALAARAGSSTLSELGVEASVLGRVAAEASGRPQLDLTPDAPGEDELLGLLRSAL